MRCFGRCLQRVVRPLRRVTARWHGERLYAVKAGKECVILAEHGRLSRKSGEGVRMGIGEKFVRREASTLCLGKCIGLYIEHRCYKP